MADLAGPEGDRGCKEIQNCNPGATTPAAVRNAADFKGQHHAAADRGSHVERRRRARRARAEGKVSDVVVAMSFVVQLRVCNASSKAKALVRNARRIGWKAGELRSATRACCGGGGGSGGAK